MIRYQLLCRHGHEFDGWFPSSSAFDSQAAEGQVSCPSCGSTKVGKAVMAPSIATGHGGRASRSRAEARMAMRALRAAVETNGEYVGRRFAEEARRIHEEQGEQRCIYGEASPPEVSALIEDGIPVLPLPPAAKDEN